jgi:uncharacterized coiled-coil protein SlyX
MQRVIKEIYEGLVKSPVVTFAFLSIAACFYMYSDLKGFVDEQKMVLTEQIKQQTQTVDLLNQISQRLADIEHKLYEDKPTYYAPPPNNSQLTSDK